MGLFNAPVEFPIFQERKGVSDVGGPTLDEALLARMERPAAVGVQGQGLGDLNFISSSAEVSSASPTAFSRPRKRQDDGVFFFINRREWEVLEAIHMPTSFLISVVCKSDVCIVTVTHHFF